MLILTILVSPRSECALAYWSKPNGPKQLGSSRQITQHLNVISASVSIWWLRQRSNVPLRLPLPPVTDFRRYIVDRLCLFGNLKTHLFTVSYGHLS